MTDAPDDDISEAHPRRARMQRPDVFRPIPVEIAAAIGYVAAHWTAVEGSLMYMARNLSKMGEHAGDALLVNTSHLGIVNIIDVWLNLAANSIWILEWTSIKIEIERLRPLRNDIIHCEWFAYDNGQRSTHLKARKIYVKRYEERTADSINALADECHLVADRIINLLVDLMVGRASDIIHGSSPPGLARVPTSMPTKPSPGRKGPRPSSAQKRKALEAEKVEEA